MYAKNSKGVTKNLTLSLNLLLEKNCKISRGFWLFSFNLFQKLFWLFKINEANDTLGMVAPIAIYVRVPSRPVGRCRPRPRRDDKRRGRPSTAVRLQPLAGSSGSTFFSYFLFDFLFLFPFLTLAYLSTSICLIEEFCASVVDDRPLRPVRGRDSLVLRRPRPVLDGWDD